VPAGVEVAATQSLSFGINGVEVGRSHHFTASLGLSPGEPKTDSSNLSTSGKLGIRYALVSTCVRKTHSTALFTQVSKPGLPVHEFDDCKDKHLPLDGMVRADRTKRRKRVGKVRCHRLGAQREYRLACPNAHANDLVEVAGDIGLSL
jgi:hypothetical protein